MVTEREAENAKKLLAGSRVFAANSRDGFVAHYPALNQLSSDRWDSRMAVAGTGTALLMIPGRFEVVEQKQLTATVLETVRDWDTAAVQTLAEFINHVTTETKDSKQIPDIIGAWVLREVPLSASEHSARQVLGLMLMNTFGPWWDQ